MVETIFVSCAEIKETKGVIVDVLVVGIMVEVVGKMPLLAA